MICHKVFVFFLSIFYVAGGYAECRFTSKEMRVYTPEEWNDIRPGKGNVYAHLLAYHQTALFNESEGAYFADPAAYFERRIAALEALRKAIEREPLDEAHIQLQSQVMKKICYLQEVPKGERGDYILEKFRNGEAITRPLNLYFAGYWCEFWDPLHRTGSPMKVRIDRWENSDIPSFFIFLEMIEYDPGFCRYAQDLHQVEYFMEPERSNHKVFFHEGRCYLNGVPFDSERFVANNCGVTVAIFTVGLDGEFYIHGHCRNRLHHSSEFGGGTVLAAGEIVCKDGYLVEITNKSGHYLPDRASVVKALKILSKRIGPLDGVVLKMIQLDQEGRRTIFKVCYDAQEYCDCEGEAWALSANEGWTPLHAAVWNRYPLSPERVREMSDVDVKDNMGNTPLHLAAQEGNLDALKLLIEAGASLDSLNNEKKLPLMLAIKNHHVEIVRCLLACTPAAKIDRALLLEAAKWGNLDIFELIMEHGIDMSDVLFQRQLLKYAVQNKSEAVAVRVLSLCSNAGFGFVDEEGNSLMHYAVQAGAANTAQLLQQKGIDPRTCNQHGETPFHHAMMFGNDPVAAFFLEKGWVDDVNEGRADGKSPLQLGIEQCSLEFLRFFLQFGVDMAAKDMMGRNIIHELALSKNKKSRKKLALLLAQEAPYVSYDSEGQAPIHLAIKNGNFLMAYWMLALTNCGHLKDGFGNSLLDHAKASEHPQLLRYLQTCVPKNV